MTVQRRRFLELIAAGGSVAAAGCGGIGGDGGGNTISAANTLRPVTQESLLTRFGWNMEFADGRAFIGAPSDRGANGATGVVYEYEQTDDGWNQVAKIGPGSDVNPGIAFGSSVAFSNGRLLVGTPGDREAAGEQSGAAYLFERSGGEWSQVAKLLGEDLIKEPPIIVPGKQRFGASVAWVGDTAVVGAWFVNTEVSERSGGIYTFEQSDGEWTQTNKFTAEGVQRGARVGWTMSAADGRLLVGAPGVSGDAYAQGHAYLFERSGGEWTRTNTFSTDDPSERSRFGIDLELSSDTIVIGMPGDDPDQGGTGNTPEPGEGIPGSVYAYRRSGGEWSQEAVLQPDDVDGGDHFGAGVARDGDTIVVGAPGDEDPGTGRYLGSAYVFEKADGEWTQRVSTTSEDPAFGQRFGHATAVSGRTALVSEPATTRTSNVRPGTVYAYDLDDVITPE